MDYETNPEGCFNSGERNIMFDVGFAELRHVIENPNAIVGTAFVVFASEERHYVRRTVSKRGCVGHIMGTKVRTWLCFL